MTAPTCDFCHKGIERTTFSTSGKKESIVHWQRRKYCSHECHYAHRTTYKKRKPVEARWTPPDLNTGEYYAMPPEATGERCERHSEQVLNAFGQCPVCAAVARQRAPADVEVFYTIDAVT